MWYFALFLLFKLRFVCVLCLQDDFVEKESIVGHLDWSQKAGSEGVKSRQLQQVSQLSSAQTQLAQNQIAIDSDLTAIGTQLSYVIDNLQLHLQNIPVKVIGEDDRIFSLIDLSISPHNLTTTIVQKLLPLEALDITLEGAFDKSSSQDSILQQYKQSQVYSRNQRGEKKLDAILGYQVTPLMGDIEECAKFWMGKIQPDGYNGSQITHCYPLSAVGHFSIKFEGIEEMGSCTGALIGPDTVLTAAHCFPIDPLSFEFSPGQLGDYKPFGSLSSGEIYRPVQFDWMSGDSDYMLVKFSENIGELTGWLGVELNGCKEKEYDLMVVGYSNDKQRDWMWTTGCENVLINSCVNGEQSGMFRHECDTEGGTSGAPLIYNNTIMGIHAQYERLFHQNSATYISREIMDFISIFLDQ